MEDGFGSVLIVDDHAAFRETVGLALGDQVALSEASSGEEAVAKFTQLRPDWVVMDLRMPGIGGLEATRQICRLHPRARIVMLSQFHEPEYGELAREAGALAFFNKEDLPALYEFMSAHTHSGVSHPTETTLS